MKIIPACASPYLDAAITQALPVYRQLLGQPLRPAQKIVLYQGPFGDDQLLCVIKLRDDPTQDAIVITNVNPFQILSAIDDPVIGSVIRWQGGTPPFAVRAQYRSLDGLHAVIPVAISANDPFTSLSTTQLFNIDPAVLDVVTGAVVAAGAVREFVLTPEVPDPDYYSQWWANDRTGDYPQDELGLVVSDSASPSRTLFAPFTPTPTSPLSGLSKLYQHYGPSHLMPQTAMGKSYRITGQDHSVRVGDRGFFRVDEPDFFSTILTGNPFQFTANNENVLLSLGIATSVMPVPSYVTWEPITVPPFDNIIGYTKTVIEGPFDWLGVFWEALAPGDTTVSLQQQGSADYRPSPLMYFKQTILPHLDDQTVMEFISGGGTITGLSLAEIQFAREEQVTGGGVLLGTAAMSRYTVLNVAVSGGGALLGAATGSRSVSGTVTGSGGGALLGSATCSRSVSGTVTATGGGAVLGMATLMRGVTLTAKITGGGAVLGTATNNRSVSGTMTATGGGAGLGMAALLRGVTLTAKATGGGAVLGAATTSRSVKGTATATGGGAVLGTATYTRGAITFAVKPTGGGAVLGTATNNRSVKGTVTATGGGAVLGTAELIRGVTALAVKTTGGGAVLGTATNSRAVKGTVTATGGGAILGTATNVRSVKGAVVVTGGGAVLGMATLIRGVALTVKTTGGGAVLGTGTNNRSVKGTVAATGGGAILGTAMFGRRCSVAEKAEGGGAAVGESVSINPRTEIQLVLSNLVVDFGPALTTRIPVYGQIATISADSSGPDYILSTSPIIYSSSNPAVASIVGDQLKLCGTGSYVVSANQAGTVMGNTSYLEAKELNSQELTAGKATQTVTEWGYAPTPVYVPEQFTVNVKLDSGIEPYGYWCDSSAYRSDYGQAAVAMDETQIKVFTAIDRGYFDLRIWSDGNDNYLPIPQEEGGEGLIAFTGVVQKRVRTVDTMTIDAVDWYGKHPRVDENFTVTVVTNPLAACAITLVPGNIATLISVEEFSAVFHAQSAGAFTVLVSTTESDEYLAMEGVVAGTDIVREGYEGVGPVIQEISLTTFTTHETATLIIVGVRLLSATISTPDVNLAFSITSCTETRVGIQVVTNNAAIGSHELTLSTPGGSTKFVVNISASPLTPTIESIEPNDINAGIVTPLTINGSHLLTAEVTSPSGYFAFDVVSRTETVIVVNATVSDSAAGQYRISTTSPYGLAGFMITVIPAIPHPFITSVTPTVVALGEATTLVIRGLHLAGAQLSGILYSGLSSTETTIRVNIIQVGDLFLGAHTIVVTTYGGSVSFSITMKYPDFVSYEFHDATNYSKGTYPNSVPVYGYWKIWAHLNSGQAASIYITNSQGVTTGSSDKFGSSSGSGWTSTAELTGRISAGTNTIRIIAAESDYYMAVDKVITVIGTGTVAVETTATISWSPTSGNGGIASNSWYPMLCNNEFSDVTYGLRVRVSSGQHVTFYSAGNGGTARFIGSTAYGGYQDFLLVNTTPLSLHLTAPAASGYLAFDKWITLIAGTNPVIPAGSGGSGTGGGITVPTWHSVWTGCGMWASLSFPTWDPVGGYWSVSGDTYGPLENTTGTIQMQVGYAFNSGLDISEGHGVAWAAATMGVNIAEVRAVTDILGQRIDIVGRYTFYYWTGFNEANIHIINLRWFK